MDKFEQRWRALVRLKDQLGRGGAAHIAREIGKEPNYISRALYPPGKDGRKRIGKIPPSFWTRNFLGGCPSKDGEDPTLPLVIRCPLIHESNLPRDGGCFAMISVPRSNS